MVSTAAPVEHDAPAMFEIVHESRLSWGRAAIKSGKYGKFLELSKNIAKKGEPARYAQFQVSEKQIADVYAIRDECDRFIALVKSE